MIGDRIRQARLSREMSLTDLAHKADVSAATLSRIENEKQGLDLSMFLTLAKILKVAPHELLGEREGESVGPDPLVVRISNLEPAERTKVWKGLTARRKKGTDDHASGRQLQERVEELIAQLDYLRGEMQNVLRRSRR